MIRSCTLQRKLTSTTPSETHLTLLRTAICGTHVLLETVRTLGTVKRFLHVSTDEVDGETSFENDEANIEAISLPEPTNPCSATKAGAEMLVMAYGRSYNVLYEIEIGQSRRFPEGAGGGKNFGVSRNDSIATS